MPRLPLSVSASSSLQIDAVAVAQAQAAFARFVEAGDAIEHGGLAGAVRPDQRGDLALSRVERQVIDRDQAAEAHGQMLDLEQDIGTSTISRGPL